MELIEIISNDVFRIPIKKGNVSVVRTIDKKFDIYIDLIKKLKNRNKFTGGIKDHIGAIENFCKKLIQAQKNIFKVALTKPIMHFLMVYPI